MPLMFGAVTSFEFSPSIGVMARDMNKFGADIRSFREPLTKSVRQVMMPSFAANFDAGGRPTQWEPLSEGTWEKRDKDGISSTSILEVTGNLRKVATSFKIWQIGTGAAAVTGLPGAEYGGLQQAGYGEKAGPPNLAEIIRKQKIALATGVPIGNDWKPWAPARPFILFQDSDQIAIQKIVGDWIMERAVRTGKFIPVG
jgi:phage gpG-like protein